MEKYREAAIPDLEGLCKILTNLGVPLGSKVLDLMSGVGRYSVNLAK